MWEDLAMTTHTTTTTGPKLLTLNEVAARAGLHRYTLMKRVAAGLFPEPIDTGYRIHLWDAAAVEAFLARGPVRRRLEWGELRRHRMAMAK
jgi:predicted DNA-binding transcriptional regulator AlpA